MSAIYHKKIVRLNKTTSLNHVYWISQRGMKLTEPKIIKSLYKSYIYPNIFNRFASFRWILKKMSVFVFYLLCQNFDSWTAQSDFFPPQKTLSLFCQRKVNIQWTRFICHVYRNSEKKKDEVPTEGLTGGEDKSLTVFFSFEEFDTKICENLCLLGCRSSRYVSKRELGLGESEVNDKADFW